MLDFIDVRTVTPVPIGVQTPRRNPVKPVALVADTMRDCSRRGSIILDSFCGSGTTILAAELTGRRAFGIEIDPHYVDVAIQRWQTITGKDAILESSGQTFDDILHDRLAGDQKNDD